MNDKYIVPLVILILVICIAGYFFIYKESNESFIVFVDEDHAVPTGCYEYLVYDGSNYYLFDSRRSIDGINNPRKFKTSEAANSSMDKKCKSLPVIDLRANKMPFDKNGILLDPQASYEWQCNRKNSVFIDKLGRCTAYAPTEEKLKQYLDLTNQQSQLTNFDLDSCMVDIIKSQNSELLGNTTWDPQTRTMKTFGSTEYDDFLKNSNINILQDYDARF